MKLTKYIYIFMIALLPANSLFAAENIAPPKQITWPFDGIFGRVDKQAAQRGYKVYKEVCSGCHAMKYIAFRNLAEIGFSEDEIKTIAADYLIIDGPNDEGEMFERPGKPSDSFPNPYPNDNAARAANNGAYPPDQSLIVKARADGANYVNSILTGYDSKPPLHFEVPEGLYYNPYFPGKLIKMAPPLLEGITTFDDGTASTVNQMAKDVVIFLQWAAEPEMEDRKNMGIQAIIFLVAFTLFYYAVKLKVWSKVK